MHSHAVVWIIVIASAQASVALYPISYSRYRTLLPDSLSVGISTITSVEPCVNFTGFVYLNVFRLRLPRLLIGVCMAGAPTISQELWCPQSHSLIGLIGLTSGP